MWEKGHIEPKQLQVKTQYNDDTMLNCSCQQLADQSWEVPTLKQAVGIPEQVLATDPKMIWNLIPLLAKTIISKRFGNKTKYNCENPNW